MTRFALALIGTLVAAQPAVLRIASDADAVKALGVTPADIGLLRSRGVFARNQGKLMIPELFNTYPLPQAFPENAQARQELRADGMKDLEIGIGETIGALQPDNGGYWFGKAIYNAEGERGRGAIGFLSGAGVYSFLKIPVVERWSVTALFVEKDAIWAALLNIGERQQTPGGLLECDRATGKAAIHAVPASIHSIVRVNTGIYLGTQNGPFVWKDSALTRIIWSQ